LIAQEFLCYGTRQDEIIDVVLGLTCDIVDANVLEKHAAFIFRAEVTKLGSEGLGFEERRLRERDQSETRNIWRSIRTNKEPSSRL
jgi:hypothetical protein